MVFHILKQVKLSDYHRYHRNTIHRDEFGNEISCISVLRIVQYPDDNGYYLIYLDAELNELTDTWHESIEKAMEQAKFEFSVTSEDWENTVRSKE
jgi:hypothetical protein